MTFTLEHRADGTCVLYDAHGVEVARGSYADCEAEKARRYAEQDAEAMARARWDWDAVMTGRVRG